MPFVSDKQRRYLWSQKPEVAKKFAEHKSHGGMMEDDMKHVKKMTTKDRYGNSVTYEYEVPKPLDETAITKHMMDKTMDGNIPPMDMEMGIEIGNMDTHPGGPKGTDTVPAWLTPGEFVVNKEATDMFGPQIEAMNDMGREVQAAKGGMIQTPGPVSYKQLGGLQESYGSDFQLAPEAPPQMWWDQESVDYLENQIPDSVKAAAALLSAIEQGEISAKKSWSFDDGGPVPLPKSYTQALLESREGYRDDVYLDSLGKPTVGHGHLLPEEYKEQVGKKPFSKKQLDDFFKMDIDTATEAARKNIKNFDKLNKKQQGALISQAFQLGPTGQAKFENMIDAIENERWDEVGAHAQDSLWAKQTPKRAQDVADAFGAPKAADAISLVFPEYQMGGGPVPKYYDIGDLVWGDYGSGNDDIWADDSTSLTGGTDPVLSQAFAAPTPGPETNLNEGLGEGQTLGTSSNTNNPWLESAVDAFTPPAPDVPFNEELYDSRDIYGGIEPPVEELDTYENINRGNINAKLDKAKNDLQYAIENNDVDAIQFLEGKIKDYETQLDNTQTLDQVTAVDTANDNIDLENEIAELSELKNNTESETVKKAIDNKIKEKRADINENKQFINETIAEDVQAGEEGAVKPEVPGVNVPGPGEGSLSEAEKTAQIEDIVNNTNEAEGPGSDQPGENVDTNKVTEAGNNATDEKKSEAIGFLKEWGLDKLMDKETFGQAVVGYLGSRLLGYSHEGSINWAAKSYLKSVTAKHAGRQAFIQKHAKNYTPASLQRYKDTGDFNTLIPAGSPVNATGDFKTFYKDGKEVRAQKYKVGDSYVWSTDGGKSVIDASYHEDASKVKGTKEYSSRLKSEEKVAHDIIKEIQGRYDKIPTKEGEALKYRTNITPAKGAREITEWAIENDIDPARVATLADQAYQDAINASGKRKPSSLKPFLDSLIIREKTGTPALFITNDKEVEKGGTPKYVDSAKMAVINRNILSLAGLDTDINNPTNIDKLGQFWTLAQSKWNQLPTDARKQYNRRAGKDVTGFYLYAEGILQDFS